MRKFMPLVAVCLLSAPVFAQRVVDHDRTRDPQQSQSESRGLFPLNPDGSTNIIPMVDEDYNDIGPDTPSYVPGPDAVHFVPATDAVNLTYHGGDVINTAKVVCIFWGPTWASGGSDNARAGNIQAFRNQL